MRPVRWRRRKDHGAGGGGFPLFVPPDFQPKVREEAGPAAHAPILKAMAARSSFSIRKKTIRPWTLKNASDGSCRFVNSNPWKPTSSQRPRLPDLR